MRRREYLILPCGRKIYKVSWAKYVRYEKIRNYILRNEYEHSLHRAVVEYRAMSLFKIDEKEIHKALVDWNSWYIGNGIRHRPIEKFIAEAKERDRKVTIQIIKGGNVG